jgi:hypothetical protein
MDRNVRSEQNKNKKTSQETHHFSTPKINRLGKTYLFIVRTIRKINTLCMQSAEFQYVKASGTHSGHWDLNG